MKRVCIGVHVYAEPERLRATLASIRANTSREVELLLLADGPDKVTRNALAVLTEIPQSVTAGALGAAACFNRLFMTVEADVLVLLESGSLVGPGWLDYLLAALADPRNGLAGPSTNLAWNEQCAFPNSGGSLEDIARTARKAARQFGHETQTLEPLHSLADFCYAARRDVIERVGAADETYGLGPCWEMDYNVRAARAGFRGMWARAAYVHRSPFTARRRMEEARRIQASKRRYQDKFCGARLRGEKSGYRSHCRGDACPNFAPKELIQIPLLFPGAASIANGPPNKTNKLIEPATIAAQVEARIIAEAEPLASCIMPTNNRRGFVPQAIRCFLRQDYSNTELLIVDDGSDPISNLVPQDERIRYVRVERKLSVGAKRNLACEMARGEFIVHWDDDDWYPHWRVRAQVRALTERQADVCGTSRITYFDPLTNRAWQYRYAASGAQWVAGNTLAYRSSFWKRNRFQDIQVAEDSRFLWGSASKTVADLNEPSLCVAIIHASNTSRKNTNGAFWHAHPVEYVRALLGDDIYFYCVRQPASDRAWPLISCIMPTYNRQGFLPLALQLFLQQDYPNKEIIVVDDSAEPSADSMLGGEGIRYIHLPARATIGAKRNLACKHARGEIIAHWDDDDWYASDRLRYQAAPILKGEADVTGLDSGFVLQLPGGEFWTADSKLHQKMFVGNVHGGTLVYRREFLAQGIKYPEVNLAEDAALLSSAVGRGKRLVRLSNPGVFVYVRHGQNAWREFAPGRFIDPGGWKRIEAPPAFPESLIASYLAAASHA